MVVSYFLHWFTLDGVEDSHLDVAPRSIHYEINALKMLHVENVKNQLFADSINRSVMHP